MSVESIQSSGFYSKPSSTVDNIVVKAEETLRRTNLQNAAKTPAGAAVATLKYVATDAIKANIISPNPKLYPPGTKFLNSSAAVKQYSKI